MTDPCEICSELIKKHQDSEHCERALKQHKKQYQIMAWVVLAMLLGTMVFYNGWAVPTLHKIIDDDIEYIGWLESELDNLSPKLQTRQYHLRLRIK